MADPMILQRLTPSHLPQPATAEELQQQVAAVAEKAKATPEDEKRKKMREKRFTFAFDFTGKNGKTYDGTFTSVVPDMKTRSNIGILRAQLAGGMPFASLDPVTSERFFVLAHLTFMLDATALPDWAKSLEALEDPDVIYALWSEVQAHEATFLGRT